MAGQSSGDPQGSPETPLSPNNVKKTLNSDQEGINFSLTGKVGNDFILSVEDKDSLNKSNSKNEEPITGLNSKPNSSMASAGSTIDKQNPTESNVVSTYHNVMKMLITI